MIALRILDIFFSRGQPPFSLLWPISDSEMAEAEAPKDVSDPTPAVVTPFGGKPPEASTGGGAGRVPAASEARGGASEDGRGRGGGALQNAREALPLGVRLVGEGGEAVEGAWHGRPEDPQAQGDGAGADADAAREDDEDLRELLPRREHRAQGERRLRSLVGLAVQRLQRGEGRGFGARHSLRQLGERDQVQGGV